MKEILAIIRMDMINQTKEALLTRGISGLNCRKVMGRGKKKVNFTVVDNKVSPKVVEAVSEEHRLIPKRMLSVIVNDSDAQMVIDTIIKVNKKGNPGDGKIFVLPVEEVIRVSTGERGGAAV
ncbi:nitrogen regulatory protein P-II [Ruminiclostridium hungatei]|uniref:Nitrogen regulatory protein P-II n=1 Tax=Ruminiclostridium hungatei TaxID=48256 RepID=A0A1V4SIU5_RUMHU|nr:P-II family nitrogen regulator [Ruminiclostridium hungatei]OPX43395.1 nitrogen regulatory protein P-II [Ruminiclostridium hungatei]